MSYIDILNKINKNSSFIILRDLEIINIDDCINRLIGFKNLKILDLSNNSIENIKSLSLLTKLEKIYLNNNKIKNISSLSYLQNLDTLDLSNNNISNIDSDVFKELKKLKYLDLQQNKLEKIPMTLFDIGLKIVWKNNNNNIPISGNTNLGRAQIEAILQGKERYSEWLKNQELAVQELKVHVIGDGGVGKTSLINQILYGTYEKESNVTQGIIIKSKYFQEENITLKFWDFGGQERYYSTHSFFFTERSLCIIVIDGRNEKQVEYWLEYVNVLFARTPVIIAINKKDENEKFDINRTSLMEKYKNIKYITNISCNNEYLGNNGLNDLRYNMINIAKRTMELNHITLNEGWFFVRKALYDLKESYIDMNKFKKTCEEEKILTQKTQEDLLSYFMNLGDLIKFEHNVDRIILNPRWLVEAVYQIMTSLEAKEMNSIGFEKKDLKGILASSYTESDYDFIINTMIDFKRCYKVNDYYYIPSLFLPYTHKTVIELARKMENNVEKPLIFIFKYKILLSSFIIQMIVSEHALIKDKLVWKTGMVLENTDKNTEAWIESNIHSNKIVLKVWGEDKVTFTNYLMESIKLINKNIFKEDVSKILIPLDKDYNTYITYKALIGYNNKGILDYFDGESGRFFNTSLYLIGRDKYYEDNKGGNIYYVKGDFMEVHAKTIEGNVIEKVQGDANYHKDFSKLDDLDKLLKGFSEEVNIVKESSKLSDKQKNELKEYSELIEKDVRNGAKSAFFDVSKKGLLEAAEAVGEVGLKLASYIPKILAKMNVPSK